MNKFAPLDFGRLGTVRSTGCLGTKEVGMVGERAMQAVYQSYGPPMYPLRTRVETISRGFQAYGAQDLPQQQTLVLSPGVRGA